MSAGTLQSKKSVSVIFRSSFVCWVLVQTFKKIWSYLLRAVTRRSYCKYVSIMFVWFWPKFELVEDWSMQFHNCLSNESHAVWYTRLWQGWWLPFVTDLQTCPNMMWINLLFSQLCNCVTYHHAIYFPSVMDCVRLEVEQLC